MSCRVSVRRVYLGVLLRDDDVGRVGVVDELAHDGRSNTGNGHFRLDALLHIAYRGQTTVTRRGLTHTNVVPYKLCYLKFGKNLFMLA